VRFFIRLQERAEDAPALETNDRWGVPAGDLGRLDLNRYEALAM
jgi:hypothetical protein